MNGDFGALRFEVTSVGPAHDSVHVDAIIKDANGVQVGWASRDYRRNSDGELIAFHNILSLEPHVRGTGFGREFSKHVEALYSRSGVHSIKLKANSDVGAYAWARQGYEFESLKEAQGEVLTRLNREIRVASEDLDDMRARCDELPPGDEKDRLAREIQRKDFVLLDARAVAKQIGNAQDESQLPRPIDIANLGRPSDLEGAESHDDGPWLGKRALLDPTGKFHWHGVKRIR